MNYLRISAIILATITTFSTYGQGKAAHRQYPNSIPLTGASAIINQLKPVILNEYQKDGTTTTAAAVGLDLSKSIAALPRLKGEITVWKSTGKNTLHAQKQQVIILEQLIPVLVSALQEQIARTNELEKQIHQLGASPINRPNTNPVTKKDIAPSEKPDQLEELCLPFPDEFPVQSEDERQYILGGIGKH